MAGLTIEKFKWGLEHEFPLIKKGNIFCDFSNTTFSDWDVIIQQLPEYSSDRDSLRIGDLGIKVKRWYIEGFERFNEQGEFLYAVPKGIEVRTPICSSLQEAVTTLVADIDIWNQVAATFDYTPAKVSFNPFQQNEFIPNPPENTWELKQRAGTSEYLHMLTYGPDINLSHPDITPHQLTEIGQKLTYYSPFIVPFSFSSPFYKGALWGGLSRRTYYRTGRRPVVAVFLPDESHVIRSTPTLTKVARLPAEVGRIEFKAFDMISDLSLYEALGTLLLGIILSNDLPGRLLVPNQALHQKSAQLGFADKEISEGARVVLKAAQAALPVELHKHLQPLIKMWQNREVTAHHMIKVYNEKQSVLDAIK